MNTKTIGILGAALVALAGVTALTISHREKAVQSAETHAKLFPNFTASLKDAAKIVVQRKDGTFTLERSGTTWGLAEKNGYPVESEPVRKTLLALAAGLKSTIEDGKYTRMLVSRPVMPLGRDIGFLPGTVDDKLNPWMQPIFDNLEFLFTSGTKKGPRAYAELLESGQLQVEPLTYIRGRSLPQQYIIVDEAQNLTPHEVKTIITRSGDGTKIVLTGDPGQIDNPYVDSQSNGLAVAADRFRGEKVAAHIVLNRGERSELAEIAANLL